MSLFMQMCLIMYVLPTALEQRRLFLSVTKCGLFLKTYKFSRTLTVGWFYRFSSDTVYMEL